MAQVIVFENDNGGVSILTPITDCGLSIEEIAAKDVPPLVTDNIDGITTSVCRPYLIIDDSELPDRELRQFWKIQGNKVVVLE